MGAAVHAHPIAGAGFDASAAVNAAQRVDFIVWRQFLNGIFRIFTGFEVNTIGLADGGVKNTIGAIGGGVLTESPMAPTKAVRIGRALFQVLDGVGSLKTFRRSKRMENMNAEIASKAITGHRTPRRISGR